MFMTAKSADYLGNAGLTVFNIETPLLGKTAYTGLRVHKGATPDS
jgi:hypothetical protein